MARNIIMEMKSMMTKIEFKGEKDLINKFRNDIMFPTNISKYTLNIYSNETSNEVEFESISDSEGKIKIGKDSTAEDINILLSDMLGEKQKIKDMKKENKENYNKIKKAEIYENISKTYPLFMDYAKKEPKALELVYELYLSSNFLMGFDFSYLKDNIFNKKEFNLIHISKNQIKDNVSLVRSYKTFVFYVVGGKELTLGEVNEMENELIPEDSEEYTYTTQTVIDDKQKNPEITILMAR